MADQQDWVKLQVGTQAKPVNADAYAQFIQNAVATLKEIDKGFSAHGTETLEWLVVNTGSNSPLFATLCGTSRDRESNGRGQDVVDSFVTGIEFLNSQNICPPHFTRGALECAKKLAASSALYHLTPVISTAQKQVSFDKSFASNADWAMKTLEQKGQYYVEYGSLEGTLRQLGTGRGHDTLVIVDRLTGHETTCFMNRRELDTIVREAWKKRVAVTGSIRVDRFTRQPVKVTVDAIRILRDRSDLPQVEDLHGIDITEGVDSAEYIRDLRDAD